jgi:hypothetical protein
MTTLSDGEGFFAFSIVPNGISDKPKLPTEIIRH